MILKTQMQSKELRDDCFGDFDSIIAVFLAAYFFMDKYYAHSLWHDFGEELIYGIVIPLIALGFAMIIRMIKSYRLSEKYGTGEGGFVYDKKMLESLNELKGRNQKLTEYTGENPVVKTV